VKRRDREAMVVSGSGEKAGLEELGWGYPGLAVVAVPVSGRWGSRLGEKIGSPFWGNWGEAVGR
jgi:hypothetical protein